MGGHPAGKVERPTFPFTDIYKTRVTLRYGAKSLSDGSVPWKAGVHAGLDLVCSDVPLIKAIRGGKVIRSRNYGAWGNYIVVEQEDGLYCIYAHLSMRDVEEGRTIEEGTVIGMMGASGYVTGRHLHIELQSDYYNAYSHVDIARYLDIVNEEGNVRYL